MSVVDDPMPPVPTSRGGWPEWLAYLAALRAAEAAARAAGDRPGEARAWSRRYAAERAQSEDRIDLLARDELRDCVLRAPAIRGATDEECRRRKVCFLCGEPLTGRQLRWCKGGVIPCWQTWADNHQWTAARHEAIRRSSGLPASIRWQTRQSYGRCDHCAESSALEVNHVEPRVGRGYDNSCAHHQTNLQVLAHACHVDETNRQASGRRAAARAEGTAPIWGEGAA